MKKSIYVLGKENVKNSIIAIGEALINKAEIISEDLEDVSSIIIHAELKPDEICNFDITKNHIAYLERKRRKMN